MKGKKSEGIMTDAEKYRNELSKIFQFAKEKGLTEVTIKSGELHKLVWGPSPLKNQMPNCCRVMRSSMQGRDEIISAPPSGDSSTVEIRYKFPRKINI